MAKQLMCDICKQPTEEIVGKLFYTPLANSKGSFANSYSHHADVGICCASRLLNSFKFQKRKTADEYHKSRRQSTKASK